MFIKKNKQYIKLKDNLELAIKELNKEVLYMKSFLELNLKAQTKILKKFKKYCKYCLEKVDVASEIEEFINKPSINFKEPSKELSDVQNDIERAFYTHFFEKYAFHTLKKLKDYANQVYFTQIQSFYFGFFMGILIILFLLCFLIGQHFNIDMDDDAEFKTIFPMFRGYAIICLYMWLLALNVYAWNEFNINYKLCFQFNNHYSDITAILKRTAVFSTVLVLMILCYMILRAKIPLICEIIQFIPLELTPLIAWISLICYLFFPNKKYFNYEGRKYLLNLFIESMSSIFIKCEFKHIWFTDQLTSMIGPIRDIEYTMCYYSHYNSIFLFFNLIYFSIK